MAEKSGMAAAATALAGGGVVASVLFEQAAKVIEKRLDYGRARFQRQPGEPVNWLQLAAILLTGAVYRHVDPLPQQKVDNLAVYGLLAYLIYLTVKPASAELGGPYAELEGDVLEALSKLFLRDSKNPKVVAETIRSLAGMPPRVEAALRELQKRFKLPENFAYFVSDPEVLKAFQESVEKSWKPAEGTPSLSKELQNTWAKVDSFLETKGMGYVYKLGSFLRRHGVTDSPRRSPATPDEEQAAYQEHRREFDRDVDKLRTRRAREFREEI